MIEEKREKTENLNDSINGLSEKDRDVKENKDTAAASYFLILSPLLLITRKDSKFIQHHASQAFILFLIFLLLWFLGSFFIFFSWLTVGVFFMALVGFIQAIGGDWYKIPYVYEMVKDGITFDGIVEGGKKGFYALKKMIEGLFPKKTEKHNNSVSENIENNNSQYSLQKEKQLELRIEKLEKLLEQKSKKQSDIKPEVIAEKITEDITGKNLFMLLSDCTKEEENKIKEQLSDLSEKDDNAEVEKTEYFYVVSGSFGEVKVGVQNGKVLTEKK